MSVWLVGVMPAQAHETEQYTLPAGRDFADLGPLLSQEFRAAIRDAVADTNAAIDAALAAGDPPEQLQVLQSADRVADQVWTRLFMTYPTNELLDLGLISPSIQARYPGLVTMYRPVESIYDDPLLMLDVSKAVRAFFRAGTVSAGGVLFGTDKIIHFINVGRIYHLSYLDALGQGLAEPEASWHAVSSTAANPLLSEDGMLGLYSTGIYSNGDLAANYAGLKFYRNLTEPVRIGGRLLPPMLLREDGRWRLVVEEEDTVFTRFVSPHWNEVLNPNSYLDYVGERVRIVIGTRCDDVADWYRDDRGQALSTAWFAAREQELATLDGEPYGHRLPASHPVSVSCICRGADAGAGSTPVDTPLRWGAALPASSADAMGRNALWWAAAAGRTGEVEQLAASGVALDRSDIDGETPLHAAVRQGNVDVARLLLAHGADANHASRQLVSPLLLAVEGGHIALSGLLLQAGADVNAQDRFGRTPLQVAARRGDPAMARLLLQRGADATLANLHGNNALELARRTGNDELLKALHDSAPQMRRLEAADNRAEAVSPPQAASSVDVQAAPSRQLTCEAGTR